jgi:hypothetical protein
MIVLEDYRASNGNICPSMPNLTVFVLVKASIAPLPLNFPHPLSLTPPKGNTC